MMYSARRLKKNEDLQPFKLDIEQGDLRLSIVLLGDRGIGKSSFVERVCENTFNLSTTSSRSPTVAPSFIEPLTFRNLRMEYQSPTMTNDLKKQIRLRIYDTIKVEDISYREFLNRCRLRIVEGCLLCFDVTNRASFVHCQEWMKEILITLEMIHKTEKKYNNTDAKKQETEEEDGDEVKRTEEYVGKQQQQKQQAIEEVIDTGITTTQDQSLDTLVPSIPMMLLGLKADNISHTATASTAHESTLQTTTATLSSDRVSMDEAQAFAAQYGLKYMECSSKDNIGVEEVIFTLTNNIVHSSPDYKQTLTKVFTEEELQRQKIDYEKKKRGHTVCRIW